MWLQRKRPPDAADHALTQAAALGHRPSAPVGCAHRHLQEHGSTRLRTARTPPHSTKSLKLSTDPLFVEKVRDVVGLYLNPPANALVLCVDEKSQIQAPERNQPLLPMGLGYLEGVTSRLLSARHMRVRIGPASKVGHNPRRAL